MKELKVTPPEGYIIDEEKSTVYNIVFKKKLELPKTWKEFCVQNPKVTNEFYIDALSEIIHNVDDPGFRKSDWDRNLLSTKEDAEAHLTLIQLHRLRDVYRQGWVPDYNNTLETKYSIVNTEDNIQILSRVTFRHFLAFQSYEIANLFLKNFKDLLIKAKELI